MMIKNTTRKTIISKDYKICKSALSKALGLMFSKKPKTLVFINQKEILVPLHMNFVFFKIDVLFLDSKKKIVEIKENFRPWSYYNPKNKAMYVIELEAGSVKKSYSKVNDLVWF